MRDIKFRGKDRENWHYGDLVKEIRHHDNKLFDGVITHIKNYEYNNGTYVGDMFPVNPETVGQYTGLKDENGKEIYEGDIIEFSYDMFVGNFDTFIAKGKVVFEEGAFYVEVFENERTTKDEAYLLYSINLDTIELMGNIYDNPELLEKGE